MIKHSSLMLLAAVIFYSVPSHGQSSPPKSSISSDQRKAIETIIKDYLLKNPIIIRQAIKNLKEQEAASEKARVLIALKTYKKELVEDDTSPVGGTHKGDITVVEFFDYNCGYCKRAATTLKALQTSDPNIRIVYKEFAILGQKSVVAAKAALAANRQCKYVKFHEGLMSGRTDLDSIASLANSLGIDYSKLRKDMASSAIKNILQKNYKLANALGISGTPVFVIGEKVIPGAVDLETLKQVVLEERAKKTK